MSEITYKKFIDDIIKTRGQWNIPEGEYYEAHHIVPRCLGGDGPRCAKHSKHKNIIWLYYKEHLIAHKLLAEENPHNSKLAYAFWNMCQQNQNVPERDDPDLQIYE